MNSTTHLSKAIKSAILFGASSTALLAMPTMANEIDSAEKVERIQVTGSRIKRADMETASPVTVIDASEIMASGVTSVDQLLQKTTAASGAMSNPGVNNGSGGNASINLRGLGSQRTLVLVNGRRMINSGTGAASTVDLNTIPVTMIQRVEVLKDGASAVYGSDAVAGVVNIILKRDFEGLELNTSGGLSGESDGEEVSIDLTMGASFDRGNIVVGIQYTDRGDASQADRGFSECPIKERDDENGKPELYCGGSSYTPYGHIWGPDGESLQGDADGSWSDFGDEDKYNYSASSYLFTPMQRLNLTALGNYELTDMSTLFTEIMYTKRWSTQQMAPQPVWFDFTYEESMGDSLLEHGLAYGDELSYGRRMTETGPRQFEQVVDTARFVIGVEGELDNGWSWDTALNFGRNDSVDRATNQHNMGSLQDAINEGDFNPLDQDAWSQESLAPYVYTEQNTGGSETLILSASLAGELFAMPAGYAGFAGGIEHRKDKAWYTPDSITSQGLGNDPRVDATKGEYDVNEAYLELALPLIADAPFAEHVELSAAMRYFDYSTFGSDSTWKLGLTWKVNDELMIRSVASTAFRAPTVDELFGGDSPSFNQIEHDATDQTQAEVTVGGNADLTPEEADTLTMGVVYEPSFLDGFSVTVDYFDTEISNAITQVDSQYIVDQCLGTDGNPINSGSALCQSADIKMDQSGRISFNNQLQNIGAENISGYDVNFSYTFEAAGLDWRTSLDTSILSEYEVEVTGQTTDYSGLITGGIGSYAEIKSNLAVNVSGDAWSAQYKARYIAGMDSALCVDDPSSCYAPTTPSVVYHDISGTYIASDMLTFTGGVNNLFDKEPPYYSGNNDSNTDPYTYDVMGRYFFVKASLTF